MAPGGGLRDVPRGGADDRHELDFPIGVAAGRQYDVAVRAGDATRKLREHAGLVGHRETGLGHVVTVIKANTERLPRRRCRGTEPGRLVGLCSGVIGAGRPAGELGPLVVDRLGLGPEPAAAGRLDVDGASAGDDDQPPGQIAYPHKDLLGVTSPLPGPSSALAAQPGKAGPARWPAPGRAPGPGHRPAAAAPPRCDILGYAGSNFGICRKQLKAMRADEQPAVPASWPPDAA